MKLLIRLTMLLSVALLVLLVVTVGLGGRMTDTGCYSFVADDATNPGSHTFIGSPGGSKLYSAPFSSRRTVLASFGTPPNTKFFYQVGMDVYWLYAQDGDGMNLRRMRETALRNLITAAWSPDGRWVAYTWRTATLPMLSIVDEAGRATRDFPLPLQTNTGDGVQWSPDSRFVMTVSHAGTFIVSALDGQVFQRSIPDTDIETRAVWGTTGHRYLLLSTLINGTRTEGFAEWGEPDNPQTRQQHTWGNLPYLQMRAHYLALDQQFVVFTTSDTESGTELFGAFLGQSEVFPLEKLDADELVTHWYLTADRQKILYTVRIEVGNGGRLVEYDVPMHTRRILLGNIADMVDANKPLAIMGRTPAREDVILIGETVETLKTYPAPTFQTHLTEGDTTPLTADSFLSSDDSFFHNLTFYPALWAHHDHYVIRAGNTVSEMVVEIYDPAAGPSRLWRKPGQLARLATLGDWIGISLKDDGGAWLLNIVTGAEISLGAGQVVWDKEAFVYIKPLTNGSTYFTIIDDNGKTRASYQASAAFYGTTPLRSPDGLHAITYTFDDALQQYHISVINGRTGQSIWSERSVEPRFEPIWLPDSSGVLLFAWYDNEIQITRLDLSGARVWTRTVEVYSENQAQIVSCSVIEQVDQLRLIPFVTPSYYNTPE